MTQALDYSLARPNPETIKAAGYVGVMRYVAPPALPKVIKPAEYAALRFAGLQVGLNWEWYANRCREGAAAGLADAQEAKKQADALGYSGAIYFSVDYDAPESDQPALDAYFQACASVLGLARLGAYAGYWPLMRLFDAGLITYGWQTLAWSGGNHESRAHLYQTGAQVFGGCDVNDVLKKNWTGESMPVPNGWTDDGTSLHNPVNSFVVTGAFRQFILGAASWNPQNVPLEDEHAQSPLEASNPSLGDGVQQVFRMGILEQTPNFNNGAPFPAWVGQEFLWQRAQLANPPVPPTPQPSDADLMVDAILKVFPKLA
jgi:hypothetical protein